MWIWGQEWPLDDITTELYPSVGPPGDDDDDIEYAGFTTTADPPGGTYQGTQEIELIVTHDLDPNSVCYNNPGDVIITYYTTDIEAFSQAGGVLGERLGKGGCKPASTLLCVSSLFHPDIVIEIEATAVV